MLMTHSSTFLASLCCASAAFTSMRNDPSTSKSNLPRCMGALETVCFWCLRIPTMVATAFSCNLILSIVNILLQVILKSQQQKELFFYLLTPPPGSMLCCWGCLPNPAFSSKAFGPAAKSTSLQAPLGPGKQSGYLKP